MIVRRLILSSKSMVIRMREFLFLVESECKDLPTIQLKAISLRWDLEKLFKFPKDAILTSAMHSDGEDRCPECGNTNAAGYRLYVDY